MKWFLTILAIGLTASEKLDRTYLPPPGAEFAGGNPGDIQVPLEPPNNFAPGTVPIGSTISGPVSNIKIPVTTTSYAFTQTTTFPPVESFETTVVPINPVTGLPIQSIDQGFDQQYNQQPGYTQNQGQSGFSPQNVIPANQPINVGDPGLSQDNNQLSNQQPNYNNFVPGSEAQFPGSVLQNANQYPSANTAQGNTIQIPESSAQSQPGTQGLVNYPTGQSGFVTSTVPSQDVSGNNQPGNQNYNVEIQGTSPGHIPQGSFTGQPINVANRYNGPPQYDQGFRNQGQIGAKGQQGPFGTQNIGSPDNFQNFNIPGNYEQNAYQPQQNYGVTGTTPGSSPTYASAQSSVAPINRPERPQAAADRKAMILSYENVRTPNSYSYSYDTSNGIHADESGIVGDGTRAQGAYSYTGDDGKVYSVIYTADENGFQPRGDHIPTPPPIPEAIKQVIEQAARDREAGIIDDGSYDEEKYGYKNYESPATRRRLQMKKVQSGPTPITGIFDENNEGVPVNQFVQDVASDNTMTNLDENLPSVDEGVQSIVAIDGPISEEDKNVTPYNENQENNAGFMQQSPDQFSSSDTPVEGDRYYDQKNKLDFVHDGTFDGKPIGSNDVKNNFTPQTEAIKDINNYLNGQDQLGSDQNQRQDVQNRRPGSSKSSVKSSPSNNGNLVIANRNQSPRQKVKGSRRPITSSNRNAGGNVPQTGPNSIQGNTGSLRDKQISNPSIVTQNNGGNLGQTTKKPLDGSAYYYIPPQNPDQRQFSSRFKGQDAPIKPQQQDVRGTGTTTRRPFITPEIYDYNQPIRGSQGNSQQNTRKPFTTPGVTTPEDSSYTDYYDDGDFNTDQEVEDDGIMSTKAPNRKQGFQTTSRPHTPSDKRIIVQEQKARPGYNQVSTTAPTQNSRFGSPNVARKPFNAQSSNVGNRPNQSAVGVPTTSQKPDTFNKNRPGQFISGYPSTTVAPGYSTGGRQPAYGSRLPSRVKGTQNYPKSTTASPVTSGYTPSSGTLVPSGGPQYQPVYQTTGRPQTSTTLNSGAPKPSGASQTYQPGYQTSQRPQTSSTYNTVAPTNSGYQPYDQRPVNRFGGVTPTPNAPGTFVPESATTVTEPIGKYQFEYQNGPMSPTYPSDDGSLMPPGSYVSQTSAGYVYGPPGSTYSTTLSPSTVGTTPGSFVYSTTPGSGNQGYSTTPRPAYPTTEGIYGQNPVVDGFGRPIVSEQQPGYTLPGQGGQYPGSQGQNTGGPGGQLTGLSNPTITGQPIGGQQYAGSQGQNLRGPGGQLAGISGPVNGGSAIGGQQYPGLQGQNLKGPGDIRGPTIGAKPSYANYYGQPMVIGENFTGPKQPQGFDPQTGYHY